MNEALVSNAWLEEYTYPSIHENETFIPLINYPLVSLEGNNSNQTAETSKETASKSYNTRHFFNGENGKETCYFELHEGGFGHPKKKV